MAISPEKHDEAVDADVAYLEKLGYKQELNRSLGLFSAFGVQFTSIAMVSSLFTTMIVGLGFFGPASFWSFVVGGALINVGYRLQDPLEDFDFEHGHDLRQALALNRQVDEARMMQRMFAEVAHAGLAAANAYRTLRSRQHAIRLQGAERAAVPLTELADERRSIRSFYDAVMAP